VSLLLVVDIDDTFDKGVGLLLLVIIDVIGDHSTTPILDDDGADGDGTTEVDDERLDCTIDVEDVVVSS
jgi:hypothetical protein